jgi:glucose/arabinose dehydrogenase
MTSSDYRSRAALLVATLALAVAVVGRAAASSTGLTTQQARTAAPSALNPAQTSATEGVSLSFARADHQHPWATIAMTTGGTSTESLACGSSPCSVSSTPIAILSTSANRFQCLVQNQGLSVVLCGHGLAAGVSSTAYQFALKAASAVLAGDGGSYSCNQGSTTWRGPISCVTASGTSTLAVSAGGI